MIEIITHENMHHFVEEMREAYRLRHDVFVEEKGWKDLSSPDGLEIDDFDNEHAVHMICRREGRVVGYQRMLPTTRPHLLSSVPSLRRLCERDFPQGPRIWEWTRYCVEKAHRERGRKLSPVANELLSAIIEWGMMRNIDSIVIEMDPLWLLRLVQLNFLVTPLGIPQKIEGEDVVAVVAKFDGRTLEMLRTMRGDGAPVLVGQSATTIMRYEV
ncbi:GNAT family N-acetyltransferase [Allorhizobium sp. BGMRC 0089]|uniref:acyl-homoserine-lactone synthase n=1 Tax=Allorhizobium sonneratiae TaxID=2934936 RepID=UPI002033B500|nr:acyl-homoserine-lactone synthase [Allorhizobium sonneratiae]MCM2294687.1 GNAT family N-acetyltransferase [Allorhizobium sonneratiae]